MPLIPNRTTTKPKRGSLEKLKPALRRVISNRNRNPNISQNIFAFVEKEGEDKQFPDAHQRFVYLKNRANRAVNLSEALFNFGFTVDGRFFYIKSEGIIAREWTNDFDTIIDEAKILPRVYIVINNLSAEIEQVHREVRIAYDVWCGKQWSKSDKIGDGLYGATNKRIEAYIYRQAQGVEYLTQMAELKNILVKLKGLLKAIEMQHASVVAAIYHTRRSTDIFSAGAGGMVNSLIDSTDMSRTTDDKRDDKLFEIEDPVVSFDVEEEKDRIYMEQKTGKKSR